MCYQHRCIVAALSSRGWPSFCVLAWRVVRPVKIQLGSPAVCLFQSLLLCLSVFLQELVSRLRQDQKAHPKALQQLEKQRQGLEKKLDGAARREAAL